MWLSLFGLWCLDTVILVLSPNSRYSFVTPRNAVCRCHSQFEGPHCEYAKDATTTKALTSSSNSGNASSGNSGIGGLGVALVVMICATILAFAFVTYRRKRKALTDQDVPPIYPDLGGSLALDDMSLRSAPVVDVGPEKDFDGNELRDVEFS